jgi:hypothetical protein
MSSSILGFANAGVALADGRTKLTATRTVWCTGNIGSDAIGASTGAATFGNGFATLQAAIDYIYRTFDGGGRLGDVLIQIYPAGGNYAGFIVSGPLPGGGVLRINGSGGTANIVGTSTNAMTASDNAAVVISNCKLTTVTSGAGIFASNGANVVMGVGMDFGTCVASQLDASAGATIASSAAYTITGGATSHMHARNVGLIAVSHAVTLTSTPAFSAYFAGVSFGFIELIGASFIGTATGPQFVAHYGGVIRTVASGVGATTLPGNTAGYASRGGVVDEQGGSPSRKIRLTGQTAAFTFTVPLNCRLYGITLQETAGAAVTGGIRIGTTLGGVDVVTAVPVGANGFVDCTLLKRLFSATANQTIYVDAVTSWNGANVTIVALYEQLY